VPRPDNTSLKPWAAPCRSTPDVSVFNVLKSPGTISGKWISPRRSTSVARAFASLELRGQDPRAPDVSWITARLKISNNLGCFLFGVSASLAKPSFKNGNLLHNSLM
jgi:hypothetical protein